MPGCYIHIGTPTQSAHIWQASSTKGPQPYPDCSAGSSHMLQGWQKCACALQNGLDHMLVSLAVKAAELPRATHQERA